MTTWTRTIGRVAFINCDPLFTGLDPSWSVLAAPPSWLTGHVLRRDCVLAPIPAADYAKHHDELVLVPDIGISSAGEVGSVILFGNHAIHCSTYGLCFVCRAFAMVGRRARTRRDLHSHGA